MNITWKEAKKLSEDRTAWWALQDLDTAGYKRNGLISFYLVLFFSKFGD
jgi:hypothetical protein